MVRIHTFQAVPRIPERLGRLRELAYNFWWSFSPDALELFARLDPSLWEELNHNPVLLLRRIPQPRLNEAARDPETLALYDSVLGRLDFYLGRKNTRAQERWPELSGRTIAYFCAEFAIHESLPMYSGGLGVLAGDHLKSASDLGVDLVGVGLLYSQGYFIQRLDEKGLQKELYPQVDPSSLGITLLRAPDGAPMRIWVDLPERRLWAQIWEARVGRTRLLLLDAALPENLPSDRAITYQLYGGDKTMRLCQEILLGIGGVRALRAAGIPIAAYHMNEGHSAFLVLELARELVSQGLSFAEARHALRARSVFTTHTPVPAGHDVFAPEQIELHLGWLRQALGLSPEAFLALGRENPRDNQEHFSMTVLALKMSAFANGVSALHGEVSRKLWRRVYPGALQQEIPIGHITNGIHTQTWLAPEMGALYDRYLPPGWRERLEEPGILDKVEQIPDEELWAVRQQLRRRLIAYARKSLKNARLRRGESPRLVEAAVRTLDPDVLTIGFARRFVTYKRGDLLLRDVERLKALVGNRERPVQFLFAGKAHPHDRAGKEVLQRVFQAERLPGLDGHVVFLENYDLRLGRLLTRGVDVWLNTPRRPREASGTSGQKVPLHGGINLSVFDGWWCEGYDGQNGWAFGEREEYADPDLQDEADALALYRLLEEEVVPLFYERDDEGIPRRWLQKVKRSIQTVVPRFHTDRMVSDYVKQMYSPAIALGDTCERDNFAKAREIAAQEAKIQSGWEQVRIELVSPSQRADFVEVGQTLPVVARLYPGPFSPEGLLVELVYGPVRSDEEIDPEGVVVLEPSGEEGGAILYQGEVSWPDSGLCGFGVRVRPRPLEGLPPQPSPATWA